MALAGVDHIQLVEATEVAFDEAVDGLLTAVHALMRDYSAGARGDAAAAITATMAQRFAETASACLDTSGVYSAANIAA